jgi:hypothetical protein
MTVTAGERTPHVDTDSGRIYFCSEGCRATYIERDVAAQ